ncbi:MAG: hypothetical protein AAFU41_16975, partial [Pseudomonadota bacterium]
HGNIGYCFQNTDMIVEDVACWTSNWADAIRKKGPQPHWHFIHGDAHDFMSLDTVEAFCAVTENTSHDVFANAAQMLLYVQSTRIAEMLCAETDGTP